MIYFSESTLGFYDSRFNKNIPDDAKEVTSKIVDEFCSSNNMRVISSSDGLPMRTTNELTTEQKTAGIESQRDRLLRGSDWYAVRKVETGVDIPVEISEYRESLRTIDELEGYPDIVLPKQPECIKFIY